MENDLVWKYGNSGKNEQRGAERVIIKININDYVAYKAIITSSVEIHRCVCA